MSEVNVWTPPPDTELVPPPPESPPETVFTDPLAADKLTLPSGGWVMVRDIKKLRSKHQKMVLRANAKAEDASGGPDTNLAGVNRGWASTEVLVAFLVLSWDIPYPADPDDPARTWVLPSNDPTITEELTTEDFNALVNELVIPARKILFPKLPTPDDHGDPSSPTEPANE